MTAIPSISLQLCMRFLDAPSLLRMARCCRSWMHAAQDPFAWGSCTLLLTLVAVRDLPPTLPPLLAHVSLSLRHRLTWIDPPLNVGVLLQWPLSSRVRKLDLDRCRIAESDWPELAAALSGVQDLSCAVSDGRTLQAVCSLHQLRSLQLSPHSSHFDESDRAALAQLESAPHLKSLTLCYIHCNRAVPIVGQLRLRRLRHFGLVCPELYNGGFLALCKSPLMQPVRSLRLSQRSRVECDLAFNDSWSVGGEEFAEGLAALKYLELITLTDLLHVDTSRGS